MSQHDEEREYPREEDTRPLRERPFVNRWPNPLWVGLDDCEIEEDET